LPLLSSDHGVPVTDADAPYSKATEQGSPNTSETNDFEMVAEDGDGDAEEDLANYELDELEAEIARELEE
jgi:hypothetical protein